ncbi:uncharacterized protein LOC135842293 [Planococcus citri]|uniref:uncharacterized protein LOC135842293 n=1 Tax=Planococcus citri TaxID=170843 RepID=UPI0031F87E33
MLIPFRAMFRMISSKTTILSLFFVLGITEILAKSTPKVSNFSQVSRYSKHSFRKTPLNSLPEIREILAKSTPKHQDSSQVSRYSKHVSRKTYLNSLPEIKEILAKSTIKDEDIPQIIKNATVKFNILFTKFIKDDLKPEENALFSPLNIYTAFSLLQLGSSSDTRIDLSNALGIPAGGVGFTAAHKGLGKILNDLETTNAAEVKIANSVFVQEQLKLKDTYVQMTKNYYKNEVQQVNFPKENSEVTDIINNWVSNNTKNRIQKLFQNRIPSDTRLLLASTLFFNATWQNQFKQWATKDEKFNTGFNEVTVKIMMNHPEYVPYWKNDTLQFEAISLPYKDNEFSMAVILPNRNKSISDLIDDLKPEHQHQLIREFQSKTEYVYYKIPRFKFAWTRSINNYVMKLGMSRIFQVAEMNNLVNSCEPVKISEINHAAEIEVDEQGTIASAVTDIRAVPVSAGDFPEPITFHVDRPFLFWIFHQKTGIILFSGIVQNPLV